jgi:hypothetical protein
MIGAFYQMSMKKQRKLTANVSAFSVFIFLLGDQAHLDIGVAVAFQQE